MKLLGGLTNLGHDYYRAQGFLAIYERLLATAKQISLDDADIDKLSVPKTEMNLPAYAGYTLGYRQALKDLK